MKRNLSDLIYCWTWSNGLSVVVAAAAAAAAAATVDDDCAVADDVLLVSPIGSTYDY
jgi:hypothetical protein